MVDRSVDYREVPGSILACVVSDAIVGGAIVAVIHHQDGSSCEAVDENGREIPYIPVKCSASPIRVRSLVVAFL